MPVPVVSVCVRIQEVASSLVASLLCDKFFEWKHFPSICVTCRIQPFINSNLCQGFHVTT